MAHHKEAEQDMWFIAKSSDNIIIHPGFVELGTRIDTGLEELEEFDNEKDWLDRLTELGIEELD